MIISTLSNIVVAILCIGVLVQTTRMIGAFRTFRKSDIGQTVAALDQATIRSAAALCELRQVLTTEVAANNRSLTSAEALRDELSVMVGVGNSVAERIMEAAAIVAPAARTDTPDAPVAGAAVEADDRPAGVSPAGKTGKAAASRPSARRTSARQAAKPSIRDRAPLSAGSR